MNLPAVKTATHVHSLSRESGTRCRLCSIGTSTEIWDQVLLESENFSVVPSKGGFVEGWVMVVPKHHVLSMAQVAARGTDDELRGLIARVSQKMTENFGPPTIFEHGAVSQKSTFGCGIDHAHLHFVPLPPWLGLRMLAEVHFRDRFKPQEWPVGVKPYLCVREPNASAFHFAFPSQEIPHQFFRQLIWRSHNFGAASYHYDKAPCVDRIKSTVARWRENGRIL